MAKTIERPRPTGLCDHRELFGLWNAIMHILHEVAVYEPRCGRKLIPLTVKGFYLSTSGEFFHQEIDEPFEQLTPDEMIQQALEGVKDNLPSTVIRSVIEAIFEAKRQHGKEIDPYDVALAEMAIKLGVWARQLLPDYIHYRDSLLSRS